MMLARRTLLIGAAAAAAASALPAQGADRFAVAKLMLFTCPVCRAAENMDAWAAQVLRKDVPLVRAPIPPESMEVDARERYYYAVREQGPTAEQAVIAALYKGTQDRQLPLSDDAQCYAWLQSAVSVPIDWLRLRERAAGVEARESVRRALRLAATAGATEVPTYLILRNGALVQTIFPAASLNEQRRELDAAFEKLKLKA